MTPSSGFAGRQRPGRPGVLPGLLVVAISIVVPPGVARAQPAAAPAFERASRQATVEAMLEQKRQGYNLLATANGARFSAGGILHLARRARERNPEPSPNLIDHKDYFDAFLGDPPILWQARERRQ